MQIELRRASLAGPSDRSSTATRLIANILQRTDPVRRRHGRDHGVHALLAPVHRPVDPYGTTTQEQAADLIIRPDMNEYEAQHAYDLDPWHPLIRMALAGLKKDPIRADFLQRYSLDRLANP